MLHGICAQLVEIQLLFHLLPSHTRLAGIAFNCAAKLYSVTSSSCWPRTVPCSDQGDMEPVSPVGLRLFVYDLDLFVEHFAGKPIDRWHERGKLQIRPSKGGSRCEMNLNIHVTAISFIGRGCVRNFG